MSESGLELAELAPQEESRPQLPTRCKLTLKGLRPPQASVEATRPQEVARKAAKRAPGLELAESHSLEDNELQLPARRKLTPKGPRPLCSVEAAGTVTTEEKLATLNKSIEDVSRDIPIPKTYQEAISDAIYSGKWLGAIQDELDTHEERGTWVIEELPKGKNTVDSKWVFTAKWDDQEGRVKYKARLVARGFTQERGLDYDETYAPTVAREAFRIFLSMIAYLGWELHQMDVKAAFIEGELKELVYMQIPEGLTIQRGLEHLVCRLVRSLYGLKQSARVWNERMTTYLKSIGFRTIHSDASIFWQQNSKRTAILAVHIDDFAIGGSTIDAVEETKSDLNNEFTMKDLGEVSTITGWRVIRDLAQRTVSINQSAYI